MSAWCVSGRLSGAAVVLVLIPLLLPLPAYGTVSGENGRIAFVREVNGVDQVFTIDPDGTDLFQVTSLVEADDGRPVRITDVAWSPTGTAVVFTTHRYLDGLWGEAKVWTVNADGSDLVYVMDRSRASLSPGGRSWAISVTAEDETTGLPTSVIGVMDRVSGEIRVVTESIGFVEPYPGRNPATTRDWDPVWFADGSRIAFIRSFPQGSPSVGNDHLYVVDLATGAATDLGGAGFVKGGPDTSPANNRIVVVSGYQGDTNGSIDLYDAGTSSTSPNRTYVTVPDGHFARFASFAPNGDELVAELENIDIWIRDADGQWVYLTEGRLPVWQPVNPYPMGLVDPTTGEWHLRDATGNVESFYYGNPGDTPFMGDWDCDGTDTPGLYRQSDGYVYLRNSNTQGNADIRFFFGNPGDVPIAGDFNGDLCDTVSIYRPSNQTFYIINRLGNNGDGLGAAEYSYVFGNPGDKPFVGDFDGDGIETVGLHRESTGLVYYRNTHTQGIADNQFLFGDPGDRFVTNDWDTDGIDTPALFRPSNTTHYFRFANTQGNADAQYIWGDPTWLPITGTYTHNTTRP